MGKSDVQISIGLVLKNLRAEAAQAQKIIKSVTNPTARSDALTKYNGVRGQIDSLTKAVGPARQQFAGWALSIMFAGMALQRMFSTIRKFGMKAFQEISHSVEGSSTGFDMLQGSMKYLGFTVGQALEPIAMLLIPIIDKVSDWVANNQGLVRSFVLIGTTLGGLFATGGMVVLAINGFKELATIIGLINVNANGIAAGSGLKSLSKFISTPVGLGVAAVLAGLAITAGLSWKAFKEVPEAFDSVKKSTKELKPYLTELKDSLTGLVQEIFPDMTSLWDLFAWTMAMGMSNLINIMKPLVSGLINIVELIRAAIENTKLYSTMMKSVFSGDFSGAIDAFDAMWSNTFDTLKDSYTRTFSDMENAFNNFYVDPEKFKLDTMVSAGIKFSKNEILDLWKQGSLGGNELRALIVGDTQKNSTLDDETRRMVEDLYVQGLRNQSITIGNLNLSSDADTIQKLLYELKASI